MGADGGTSEARRSYFDDLELDTLLSHWHSPRGYSHRVYTATPEIEIKLRP